MSDPIRVLMVVDGIGPQAGGGERMAIGLSDALQGEGFEVAVCVTRSGTPPGSARDQLEAKGVKIIALDRPGRIGLRGFGPLRKHLREERPDILHAHKFGSNVWGVLFGRSYRLPGVIAHEQTWSFEGKPHRVAIDFLIGRLASRFVTVSSEDRRRMIERERVPPEKVVMIPNAFIPRADDGSGDLRRELGLSADAPVIGTAAVLRKQKALEVLIDAFAKLSRTRPDAQLVIAGEGSQGEQLRGYAAERAVGNIHFIGRREDMGALLGTFDIAAMSSDYEGTPLFALECMAHGTPLVATDVGGLPDLVESGTTGILVPPRDPDSLAAALEDLLADPARRERLAAAGVERSKDFSIERIAGRFADLYRTVLAEARA
jgi:glycosyltransferase involved in cell wall biosynthesis